MTAVGAYGKNINCAYILASVEHPFISKTDFV